MWWLILPLGLTVLVFHSITRNFFFGDDLYNVYRIVNGDLLTYLIAPYGGHLLLSRNALFYLCHRLFGVNPEGYFWVVLATHLVNVALLWRVIRLWTSSVLLAAFGAALWGAAPLHEGTLGWYSVYGNVVVATCLLWLLVDLGRAAAGEQLARWTVLRWAALILVASTSFGVGLAVAVVFPLLIVLVHPPGRLLWQRALFSAAVIAPILVVYPYWIRSPLAVGTPAIEFAPSDLLAVWDQLLGLFCQLGGYGIASLFMGPLYVPSDLTGAPAYVLIALYFSILFGGLACGGREIRRRILACAILCLAAYGVVAAGRGVLWGGLFLLATRYQYVALLSVTLALCLSLAAVDRRRPFAGPLKRALLVGWLIAFVAVHLTFGREIEHHAPSRIATERTLAEIRNRIAAVPPGGEVFIPNRVFAGVGPLMRKNPRLFPGWAAAFVIFFPDNVVDARRVFFVIDDPEVLAVTLDGRRTAGLVVGPERAQ